MGVFCQALANTCEALTWTSNATAPGGQRPGLARIVPSCRAKGIYQQGYRHREIGRKRLPGCLVWISVEKVVSHWRDSCRVNAGMHHTHELLRISAVLIAVERNCFRGRIGHSSSSREGPQLRSVRLTRPTLPSRSALSRRARLGGTGNVPGNMPFENPIHRP